MPQRELIAARARAQRSRADMVATIAELKERLKPANIASDAWSSVKEKGTQASGQGVKAITSHPGSAGGIVAALALFLLRQPLAQLVTRIFGGTRPPGEVKANLLDTQTDYDLTAPVVVPGEGKKL